MQTIELQYLSILNTTKSSKKTLVFLFFLLHIDFP